MVTMVIKLKSECFIKTDLVLLDQETSILKIEQFDRNKLKEKKYITFYDTDTE